MNLKSLGLLKKKVSVFFKKKKLNDSKNKVFSKYFIVIIGYKSSDISLLQVNCILFCIYAAMLPYFYFNKTDKIHQFHGMFCL